MSDRDQGVAPEGPHGRVAPSVPQPLLRRLEALLGERQEIIVALETLALGDGGETRLLRRRLTQVASEQALLLDELDALVRVRGECAAPRPAKPPPAANEMGPTTARRDCTDVTDESRSTQPSAAPHRGRPTLR